MPLETPVQPKLADLLAKYLDRQAEVESLGLANFDADEVVPYEAGPVQPIDPKLAWDEAMSVATLLGGEPSAKKWKAPPQWAYLVAQHEPEVALPLCVGNYPQMVRNFHMLLQQPNLAELMPRAGRSLAAEELLAWAAAQTSFPEALMALAGLRLAKQFDAARALIGRFEPKVSAAWRSLWDNEKAALAWHEGKPKEALDFWEKQPATVPIRFNRGMAHLFLGQMDQARAELTQVVAQLPEDGAWHHLARLYLALAQMRRS